jgi:hypothetical protein
MIPPLEQKHIDDERSASSLSINTSFFVLTHFEVVTGTHGGGGAAHMQFPKLGMLKIGLWSLAFACFLCRRKTLWSIGIFKFADCVPNTHLRVAVSTTYDAMINRPL